MECSGSCSDRETAQENVNTGTESVLFAQKANKDVDATVVYGINHQELSKEDKVISNASCTSNCIVPVGKVVDDGGGREAGVITTIHSAMNDQPGIDS